MYCFVVMETMSVLISIIKIGLIFLDFCSFDSSLLATVSQVCVHHLLVPFSKEQSAKIVKGSAAAIGLGEKFF